MSGQRVGRSACGARGRGRRGPVLGPQTGVGVWTCEMPVSTLLLLWKRFPLALGRRRFRVLRSPGAALQVGDAGGGLRRGSCTSGVFGPNRVPSGRHAGTLTRTPPPRFHFCFLPLHNVTIHCLGHWKFQDWRGGEETWAKTVLLARPSKSVGPGEISVYRDEQDLIAKREKNVGREAVSAQTHICFQNQ